MKIGDKVKVKSKKTWKDFNGKVLTIAELPTDKFPFFTLLDNFSRVYYLLPDEMEKI